MKNLSGNSRIHKVTKIKETFNMEILRPNGEVFLVAIAGVFR